MNKKRILFICTGNSARSQMAEGMVNSLFQDKFEAKSAGLKPTKVNSYAIEVMKEIGIDISHHRSKAISEFYGKKFDIVVTVCDNAKKFCPTFPGVEKVIHKSFFDPVDATGSEEDILKIFRDVRNQIKNWIENNLINM
jgi:arsenate reductase